MRHFPKSRDTSIQLHSATKRGILCAIGRIRLEPAFGRRWKSLSLSLLLWGGSEAFIGMVESYSWNPHVCNVYVKIVNILLLSSYTWYHLVEGISVGLLLWREVGCKRWVRDFIWWYVCFLAEDNQGIAWPVWRGGASLKSCPAIDHRTFLQCAFQMSLKSWPCHWPPALLLAQQLSSSMTTKGWPMGVTKATHLISWSDALIQDNLAKLEFLGSTVAPFLNLNDAHFGRLLSPERHFSSAYLGLQALLVTRRRGEWVVDGYSSPLTLLNPSLCFF